ncbi:MAG: hypothetical protein ACYS7M_13460, partial [Planctomycetota bacterium]
VFWDTERRDLTDFDPAELNAAQIIASELTTEDSSAQLSTEDLVEDVYHLGVYVDDGLNAPVAAYAPGQLSVTKTPTLAVTAPASGVIIRPSQQATVSWTTNVPATAAQTEVFVMADTNNDGVADGDKVVVRELNSDGSTSAIWEPTGQVGKFLAFVRLVFEDPSVVLPPDQAPGFIRVSTAPQIIWVGAFADPDEGEQSQGAILEGHQFEDNLGSAVSPAGDLDSDGSDDFLIAARYGKPFFANPEGIGHGAAYLIYGSHDRLRGRHNINTLGTGALRGVTFTGIRTPQGNSETDGLAVVTSIPDVDGDDNDELLFGFPEVDSRGHNMDPSQDGVRPEVLLDTLEKHDQFLRGGIVIVSSTSSILRSPDSDTPVINLDTVGQGFDVNCVLFEPGREDDAGMTIDAFSVDEATGECFGTDGLPNGGCDSAETDSAPDSTSINWGFVSALSDDYFTAMWGSGCLAEFDFHLNPCRFIDANGVGRLMGAYCADTGPGCFPTSPALHGFPGYHLETTITPTGYSGYYPDYWDNNDDGDPGSLSEEDIVENEPHEPFGARIIGVGLDDAFGASIGLSNLLDSGAGDIIVSAPNRTARGILFQQQQQQQGIFWEPDWPETGGEIDGLERPAGTPATNPDSGVAYMFALRSLWTETASGRKPPKPHQYVVGEPSHCGNPPPPDADGFTETLRIGNLDAVRIAGAANEKITHLQGIPDFNDDTRNDFAVGAPESDKVYIAFRAPEAL